MRSSAMTSAWTPYAVSTSRQGALSTMRAAPCSRTSSPARGSVPMNTVVAVSLVGNPHPSRSDRDWSLQRKPFTHCDQALTEPKEKAPMADLQKLIYETRTQVTDREILATARLNARVKAFAGRELSEDIVDRINEAVADEADQLVAEGGLPDRPDWLAVIVRRRLYVAFGSSAVQQLSRELKGMGAF